MNTAAILSAAHALHFIRPWWLLAIVPLWLLAFTAVRQRVARGSWTRLVDAELLASLKLDDASRSPSTAARFQSPWPWLALAWTLAALALAGPSWQRETTGGYRSHAAWVAVLDLSPSMADTDVAPSRIGRARYAIDDLLAAAHDTSIGLIAFGAEPYTVTPLTEDAATVRALLPPLVPDIMPTPGDKLAPALGQAATLLQKAGSRDTHLIVVSDGVDDAAASLAAAAKLHGSGVTVDVLEIADGQVRPDRSEQLRQLARAGGGRYFTPATLPALIAELQNREPSIDSGADTGTAARDVRLEHWQDAGIWLMPLLLVLTAALTRRGWL